MFFKGSRYAKVPLATITNSAGRVITFATTRFIPTTQATAGHRVLKGERLDHIAWEHFRDAQRFWRICDANTAMRPDDLLEEAAIIGIPPAEG